MDAVILQEILTQSSFILNSLQAPVMAITLSGEIGYCNDCAQNLLRVSREDAFGRTLESFLSPNSAAKWQHSLNQTKYLGTFECELECVLPNKTRLSIHAKCALRTVETGAFILVTWEVLTRYKQLEFQLFRIQRMAALGLLVSGVAHDMNNVISLFVMAIRILSPRLTDAHSQEIIKKVEAGTHRGTTLVRQMLYYIKGIEEDYKSVELQALIEEVVAIARTTFPESIKIHAAFAEVLCPIYANSTQVHQVILNLMINARDAMEEKGGTLHIQAETRVVREDECLTVSEIVPGSYSVLEVKDSGSGIPSELLEKIYEPFFTTKEDGKGTGLGLSTVFAIVKNHAGAITVESALNQGTLFRIYFPAIIDETKPIRA